MWFDREAIAFALLAVAGLWIIWIDARPFVQNWWQNRKGSLVFTITENVHCESRRVESSLDKDGDAEFFENVFYLVVRNALDSGKTLKRAQARIFFLGPPTLCRIRDTASDNIDIRHGEWAFFEIGRLVSKDMMGQIEPGVVNAEKNMDLYKHNIPRGHLTFEVYSVGNNREYGLGHSSEGETVWTLFIVFSADDQKSRTVNIKIDMTKTRSPVWHELFA